MSDDDPFEGLDVPGEDDLARADQVLTVRVESRRYDKPMTVVEGFDPDVTDTDEVATMLKKQLGAGGTAKETSVEVQGDHAERARDILESEGFQVD
ncbi:translation initiation factor [Halobacterium wangiae]|uniref:translation initiation factor n=1 Tax=Halobacterium wangiae TaxID=2902623 RepID=UPI001E508508|nr:translation initiation factor [Halobacterium wangiae]